MTALDVTLKLTEKFPAFLKAQAPELEEILDALKGFLDSDLDSLWSEFRDTWTVNYSPRRAHFLDLAKKLNLRKVGSGPQAHYAQICYVCAAAGRSYRYSIAEAACPECGDSYRPLHSVCYRGHEVSQERAQEIVDRYPVPVSDGKVVPRGNLNKSRVLGYLDLSIPTGDKD